MRVKSLNTVLGAIRLTFYHWLALSCLFSCILAIVRVIFTGHLTFLFLLWNLFLAFVPFLITELMSSLANNKANNWKRVLLFTAWLLFIPNSFYIITDLFHLETFDTAPKWFDLLLIFSFAWNGIMLGAISIRKVECMLNRYIPDRYAVLVIGAIMLLNSFGIYIGRYLRFNSWDIISRPFILLEAMLDVIIHPFTYKMEWGMIIVYAIFMTMAYITLKKTQESFQTLKFK